MNEYGGYIQLDTYRLPMLHENSIKLNCGRNALWYLIKSKGIKTIWMPKFMCNSCDSILEKEHVKVYYYSIDINFKPINIDLKTNDWVYIVNFYGQLSSNYLTFLKKKYRNIIIDNAQAYFQEPINDIDTIYTCRKFFGVSDGAMLYTNTKSEYDIPQDESFERMHFLLGRFERNAGEFYAEYIENNNIFLNEPIKKMSKLTYNLLHGIDYDFVENRRRKNFEYLDNKLREHNLLSLVVPKGAFMYPLYLHNGFELRKKLQSEKIFIPILWPAVFSRCDEASLEYDLALNILPIPVDQRYDIEDMEYMVSRILTLK